MTTPDALLAAVAAARPTPLALHRGWWTEADVLAAVAARDQEWIAHLEQQKAKEGTIAK